MKFKTIIIDDESLARKRLKFLLEEFPEVFEIIDEAKNGREALTKIESQKPDLIFLDIEMPGLNGFELIEKLSCKPIVIFCTAFDHYAVKAFETHSIDYLLKPVEKERLQITVNKLSERAGKNPQIDELINNLKNYLPKEERTTISIKIGDSIKFIKLEDVIYFEACANGVEFFDKNGKKYYSDNCLRELEEKLPSAFCRISKSVILNKNRIVEVKKQFRGKYAIFMDDSAKTKLISGGVYSDNISKIFNNF